MLHLCRILSLRYETGRLKEPSTIKYLDEQRRVLPARATPPSRRCGGGPVKPGAREPGQHWAIRHVCVCQHVSVGARVPGCVPACVRDSVRVSDCERAGVRVPARLCPGARASCERERGGRPGLARPRRLGRAPRPRGSSGSRFWAQAPPWGLGEDSVTSTSPCVPFSLAERGVELSPRALAGIERGTEGERRRGPELGHIGPGERLRGERPQTLDPPDPRPALRALGGSGAAAPTLGASRASRAGAGARAFGQATASSGRGPRAPPPPLCPRPSRATRAPSLRRGAKPDRRRKT